MERGRRFQHLWQIPHYETFSMWELMKAIDPDFLGRLLALYGGGAAFEILESFLKMHRLMLPAPDPRTIYCPDELRALAEEFRANGMKMCALLLEDQAAESTTDIAKWHPELQREIDRELRTIILLRISAEHADYYDKPQLFGPIVDRKFPKACDDIREAGTCLALGRWPAVVHHSMAVAQIGLTALGKHLRCKIDIHVDTWEQMFQKVEAGIKAKRQAMPTARWKRMEPFYNEALSDLRHMRGAWRNPGAHYRRDFDEEKSSKVLGRVREFMQNLATRIGSRK
jgi:hypothetical protein